MDNDQFPTYLINLKRDIQRRKRSTNQLNQSGIQPIIIEAIDAHDEYFPFSKYRDLSRGKWWDLDKFKPGAFGCYLSHAKCWDKICNSDSQFSLVLEDDSFVNADLLSALEINNEIESFDIIFINFGLTRLLKLATCFNPKNTKFVPIDKLLADLLIHNKFSDNLTPGSYGYLVSKRGAAKLLQMMDRERVCMGVDYAMLFSSLSDDTLRLAKESSNTPRYLQIYIANTDDKSFYKNQDRVILDAYISTLPAIVSHHDSGTSSLKHEIFRDFDVFNKRDPVYRKFMRYLHEIIANR